MDQTAMRRRNLDKWISADPWTVTFYAAGRTPDADETSFSATGRVSPASSRDDQSTPTGAMQGEVHVTRYLSILVVPWDTTAITKGMRVTATHDGSGLENEYTVLNARHVPHKWEVFLDERQ